MIFYFKIIKHIQFLVRKIQKNKFCASFKFYFLCIFLVIGDLVSKHEQLLILTGIDASTLILICGSKIKVTWFHHENLDRWDIAMLQG
jgi:hypothetical protein